MPGRGRHAAAGVVRHRAGRAAGRLRPSQPGGHGAAAARPGAGQRPRRGGLVQTSTADGLAQLRRPRRGSAHRAARRDRGGAGRARQNSLGRRGIRLSADIEARAPATDPTGPLATHVRHPPGAQPARAGRGPRIVDRPRRDRPTPRHRARAASCPIRRSSTPPPPIRRPSTNWSPCRYSADAISAAARRRGWRHWSLRGKILVPRTTRSRPIGPPAPARWGRRRPRGSRAAGSGPRRAAGTVGAGAVPAENLVSPDLVRRLCWEWEGPPTSGNGTGGHHRRVPARRAGPRLGSANWWSPYWPRR